MKIHVSGECAFVPGPSYDLARVLAVHETVIDSLAAAFGAPKLVFDLKKGRRPADWPEPGKAMARDAWRQLKALHDVTPVALTFRFAEMTVLAHLLGNVWCNQNADTSEVTLNDRKAASEFDPFPVLYLFGAMRESGAKFDLLPEHHVDRIAAAMTGPLAGFGLDFHRSSVSNPGAAKRGKTGSARIIFPHAAFGSGHAWLNVHCRSSDGGQPDSMETEN